MRRGRRRIITAIAVFIALAVALTLAVPAALYYRARTAPVPAGAPTAAPSGEGWLDLLSQSNEQHWRYTTDDPDNFEIHDGVLHIFGNAFFPLKYVVYTGETFGDFELHLEFRLAKGANSGLFLRSQPDDPVQRGFEIQILDDHGARPNKHGSGAIYDVVTPMFNLSRPQGEWNSFDVRVEGAEIDVVMNGWLVVKADLAQMTEPLGKFDTPYAQLPRQGMIMLQDHGGEVWFRNLRLRPIPAPQQPSSPPTQIPPRAVEEVN